MAQATYHFPRGFLWGTATSSHQVEGNNTNNQWWAWEQEPGHIHYDHRSGLACDWWGGRWREDFDRAAEAGQNALRMSIEWSRIQPAPDRWDEDALDHYRQMVRGLHERDLIPLVTLHHFTDPLWVAEQGGWENPAVVEQFGKYARKVAEALKDYVYLWVTINEPDVYAAHGYVLGEFPPAKKDLGAAIRVAENMLRGHAAAYRVVHSVQPTARAGLAINFRGFRPARSWSPFDRVAAGLHSFLFNDFFLRPLVDGVVRFPLGRKRVPELKGTQDFVGLNYYTRELVSFNPLRFDELLSRRYFDPKSETSDNGFLANEPEGFFEALQWARQVHLPIIVTENGVEDADDDLRPRFIAEHIHQLWRAVNSNWPVKGYFHWSLVDNFEWERGWTQRFGLWELVVETQARRRRPSVDFYAEICRENGLSSEMVARYAPAVLDKLFPG